MQYLGVISRIIEYGVVDKYKRRAKDTMRDNSRLQEIHFVEMKQTRLIHFIQSRIILSLLTSCNRSLVPYLISVSSGSFEMCFRWRGITVDFGNSTLKVDWYKKSLDWKAVATEQIGSIICPTSWWFITPLLIYMIKWSIFITKKTKFSKHLAKHSDINRKIVLGNRNILFI